MEYIVLDNEWHTSFRKINGKCLNELIEIGAVKLDSSLREVSRFSVLIKSTLTKKLSGTFRRLTNITTEEMRENGVTFEEAVNRYAAWAGNDAVTMTWSNSDIYVLLENFRFRRGIDAVPIIGRYIDLQKYVQSEMTLKGAEIKSQISVANAATALGISTEGIELHRALEDSLLCAEILRKVYNGDRIAGFITDTGTSDFYKRLTFKAYVIRNIDNPYINKKKMEFKCEKCGCDAVRKTPWAFKGRCFRAEFVCGGCGYTFVGRVSFKKYYDKVVVKHNTSPVAAEKEKENEI